jgi:hypothetical protein
MTATHVDFTSYVDKSGYRIIPPKQLPRRPGQSVKDWLLSHRMDEVDARIIGVGGAQRKVLLNQYPNLFQGFTKVNKWEDLLKFVTQYGPLTPAGMAGRKGDEISPLLDAAKAMRACFTSRGRRSPSWAIATLRVRLVVDKARGTLVVKMHPATLLDALWLQLGHALSGGTQWRRCQHCGDPFPVGGNSGRRLVAKFCSDEHRIKFNSLERSR